MNITQFLSSDDNSKKYNITSTNHNSYIEIHNSLFIVNYDCNVYIDKVLDITGHCTLDTNCTINSSMNINGSLLLINNNFNNNFNIIHPGTFIGVDLYYDLSHVNEYKIHINGYVMHHGVLS